MQHSKSSTGSLGSQTVRARCGHTLNTREGRLKSTDGLFSDLLSILSTQKQEQKDKKLRKKMCGQSIRFTLSVILSANFGRRGLKEVASQCDWRKNLSIFFSRQTHHAQGSQRSRPSGRHGCITGIVALLHLSSLQTLTNIFLFFLLFVLFSRRKRTL